MDRIYDLLNGVEESLKKQSEGTLLPVPTTDVGPSPDPNNKPPIKPELVDQTSVNESLQKGKDAVNKLQNQNPDESVSRPNGDESVAGVKKKFKIGDKVKNIDKKSSHYGSEGIVRTTTDDSPEYSGYIGYETTNSGGSWTVDQYLRKSEDHLALIDSTDDYGLAVNTSPSLKDYDIEEAKVELELQEIKKKLKEIKKSKGEDYLGDDDTLEEEMMEYKSEFYEMSLISLRSILSLVQHIIDNADKDFVKENLTESWLQGKIAVTEDYVTTIHNCVMYNREEADTDSSDASDKKRPGLWENIRKKKEREGKNYKPAKPGDKDRPDPKQWKKLTK